MKTPSALAFLTSVAVSFAAVQAWGDETEQEPRPVASPSSVPSPAELPPEEEEERRERKSRRNSTGMMVAGIVMMGVGGLGTLVSVAFAVGSNKLGNDGGEAGGIAGAIVCGSMVAIGVPLTVYGASRKRSDLDARRDPLLLIGDRGGGVRFEF